MTKEEAVALLERYSNYDGMGIQNLAGCKEAMRVAVDALKEACPELAESEDERIIRLLRELGSLDAAKELYEEFNLSYTDVLFWLEKQKEKQKEQKSMEKPDYSGLNDLERAILRGFLADGVENVPVGIIKETAQECLTNIKPAEWSEEDEKNLELVTDWVYEVYPDPVMKYKLKDWLKSLSPSWKPSEEQMEALQGAITYMAIHNMKVDSLVSLHKDLKKL